MISNQNLIFYACIAKGSTIVAEFSRDPSLVETAQKCIEKTPPYHSMFSHTVQRRTYTFLIQNRFTYFAIASEDLDRPEGLWFLNRVRQAFEEKMEGGLVEDSDDLAHRCFQREADPIFGETLVLDFGLSDSPATGGSRSRSTSLESSAAAVAPLLGQPGKGLKKKKRGVEMMGNGNGNMEMSDVNGNGNGNGGFGSYRDVPQPMHKSAPILFPATDRQRAKQVWKKHVWVVLVIDLFVCSILFGIWLWVCRGLQCIDA